MALLMRDPHLELERATRPVQKSDYLIVNRRREEENRNKMLERTQYYAQTAMQSQFEETSTLSIKRNHLFRRVEELRAVEEGKLEARRERLRQLYASDEMRWTQELLSREETKETRLEKMRSRMEHLKARREAERRQTVEEKLLQRWRNGCDELRQIESKVLEEQVALARADQLVELDKRRSLALEEKKFYDDLWEKDRQKKIAKEEEERARHKELNSATVAMLEAQLDMLRQQAIEEERLKQEEAILMRQEMETRTLEDERNRARKLAEQRIIRTELDKFNRMKIEQRAREVQESLAVDLKIVDQFFKMDAQETENRNRRRAELKKEIQLYREHLREQQRIERERQSEIDKMQKEEEDKLWRKRAEKWQREQAARDRLMKEVLEGRKEQLKYSLHQNRLQQEKTRVEREEVLKQIEAARKVEAAEKLRKEALTHAYRESLAAQVEIVEEKKREDKRKAAIEANADKIAELKYRELLELETQRVFENPSLVGRGRGG
ncbi:tumor suppressor, Mitostatin-domain-containing protein [Zopfochytrium polystomum]|nr:tumor suppressor, Mitostatin-domain-containing protein [Zopfochytrium polystomum]